MIKKPSLKELVAFALIEDMPRGDVTTDLVMHETRQKDSAKLVSKGEGVFYGTEIIHTVFQVLNQSVSIDMKKQNGDILKTGEIICQLNGDTATLLKAERVLLNFTQRLSGVATMTRQFVGALDASHIQIVDTRKTTPLLRELEKKAVLAGGGFNHRHSLSDMVLIKDNHLAYLRKTNQLKNLGKLIENFKRSHTDIQVEVEVDSLEDLRSLDLKSADIIMLDNFKMEDIRPACTLCQEKGYSAKIEVSGNITLDTISAYKSLPIHRIAIGAITHSVKSLDLSLEF